MCVFRDIPALTKMVRLFSVECNSDVSATFSSKRQQRQFPRTRGDEMNETTFDIFSGAPEENGLWVEAVEGLSNARQRMGQIAAQKPGKYFLFSRSSHSILTRIN